VGCCPHPRAWAVLMKRLGYTKFVAQAAIGAQSSPIKWSGAAPELLANSHQHACIFPAEIDHAAFSGSRASGLSSDEKLAYERLQLYIKRESPTVPDGLRPQTYTESQTPPSA